MFSPSPVGEGRGEGTSRTKPHLRVFQHFADNLYRFFLNLLTVLSAEEAFAIDFVRIFVPDGRAANQPFSVITFRPPMDAPLPGAAVRRAVIGSPARVLALTISGESLDRAAFWLTSR